MTVPASVSRTRAEGQTNLQVKEGGAIGAAESLMGAVTLAFLFPWVAHPPQRALSTLQTECPKGQEVVQVGGQGPSQSACRATPTRS